MDDITQKFIAVLNEAGSVDVAEAEFKRLVADDHDLKAEYTEWCNENGSSFRNGFLDFCEEYLASRNSIWDTLTDYDE